MCERMAKRNFLHKWQQMGETGTSGGIKRTQEAKI
jgi:hypothetical protein